MESVQRVPDIFAFGGKIVEEELNLDETMVDGAESTRVEDFLNSSDCSIEISAILDSISVSVSISNKDEEEADEIKNILLKKSQNPLRKSVPINPFAIPTTTRANSTRTVSLSGKVLTNSSCYMPASSSKDVNSDINYPKRVSNPLTRSCNIW